MSEPKPCPVCAGDGSYPVKQDGHIRDVPCDCTRADPALCTGCEGKPAACNDPCAVCGKHANPAPDASTLAKSVSWDDIAVCLAIADGPGPAMRSRNSGLKVQLDLAHQELAAAQAQLAAKDAEIDTLLKALRKARQAKDWMACEAVLDQAIDAAEKVRGG